VGAHAVYSSRRVTATDRIGPFSVRNRTTRTYRTRLFLTTNSSRRPRERIPFGSVYILTRRCVRFSRPDTRTVIRYRTYVRGPKKPGVRRRIQRKKTERDEEKNCRKPGRGIFAGLYADDGRDAKFRVDWHRSRDATTSVTTAAS